jgi:hypothetical protein
MFWLDFYTSRHILLEYFSSREVQEIPQLKRPTTNMVLEALRRLRLIHWIVKGMQEANPLGYLSKTILIFKS